MQDSIEMSKSDFQQIATNGNWLQVQEFDVYNIDDREGVDVIQGCAEKISINGKVKIIYHEIYGYDDGDFKTLTHQESPDVVWRFQVVGDDGYDEELTVIDDDGEPMRAYEIIALLPEARFDHIDYSELESSINAQ